MSVTDSRVLHGDCIELMRTLPDNSVDAVVTDPPYGLSFMGKKWDYDVPSVEVWAECLRVLKPGGHLLAFAGTRTQHRMAGRIEDAGFEIRDMIAWVYGSGFPKSLDVSKAIDKAAGVRGHDGVGFNAAGIGKSNGGSKFRSDHPEYVKPSGITDAARQWQGWGTALKPALEPITVARKPLIGTVAENVLQHGTGALNVDGCRVGDTVETWPTSRSYAPGQIEPGGKGNTQATGAVPPGRWPANLIHDGSEEVVGLFPTEAGAFAPVPRAQRTNNVYGSFDAFGDDGASFRGDTGSAARFFYCAKASAADRDAGVAGVAGVAGGMSGRRDGSMGSVTMRKNTHPTVKPTKLMRYLVRLVTPPGGTVLDPFMGSGSTGKAAKLEGFNFIGIEREETYVETARARIAAVEPEEAAPEQPTLFD